MATVLVWNQSKVSHVLNKMRNALGGYNDSMHAHAVTGHACINITDTWVEPIQNLHNARSAIKEFHEAVEKEYLNTARDAMHDFYRALTDNSKHYASWWPSEDETTDTKVLHWDSNLDTWKFWKKIQMVNAKKAAHHENLWRDLLEEKYSPDHVIHIPSNSAQEKAMLEKWEALRTKEDASYRLLYKNCSRIVARILEAGYKDDAPKGWWKRHFKKIFTPLDVKRMSLDLHGAETLTWVDFVDQLAKAGAIGTSSATELKAYRRRSSARGSTQAPARFDVQSRRQVGYLGVRRVTNADEAKKQERKNTPLFMQGFLGSKKLALIVGEMHDLKYDGVDEELLEIKDPELHPSEEVYIDDEEDSESVQSVMPWMINTQPVQQTVVIEDDEDELRNDEDDDDDESVYYEDSSSSDYHHHDDEDEDTIYSKSSDHGGGLFGIGGGSSNLSSFAPPPRKSNLSSFAPPPRQSNLSSFAPPPRQSNLSSFAPPPRNNQFF